MHFDLPDLRLIAAIAESGKHRGHLLDTQSVALDRQGCLDGTDTIAPTQLRGQAIFMHGR